MSSYGQEFSKEDDEQKAGTNVQAQWSALKSTHTQDNVPHDINPASKAVLDSLRQRRCQDTAAWLGSLVVKPEDLSARGSQSSNPEAMAMIEWADRLFDKLEKFATRFSVTAVGTDLIVSFQRPEFNLNKKTGFADDVAIVFFDGHLTTLRWAMFIRGIKGRVKFFIIPADRLLGFTNSTYTENDYQPFMELDAVFQNDQLNISHGGETITGDMVDPLAKELFGDLIRVASGTMSESELFAHPTTELKLGETVAVGYQSSIASAAIMPDTQGQQTSGTMSDGRVSMACTDFMQAIAEGLITAAHEKEKAEVVFDSITVVRLGTVIASLTALKKQVGDAIGQYNDSLK